MTFTPPAPGREPKWESAALALVNSEHWYGRGSGGRQDQLPVPGWLERYLAEWRLTPSDPVSAGDRRRLATLRAVLRRAVTQLHEGGDAANDLARLRPYVEAVPLRRSLVVEGDAARVELVPLRRDWDWVLGEIAVSLIELLGQGGHDRIRLCSNDECGWAFFDKSRNRGRRWCDMRICGNVDKVRRFRDRQAEAA